jgi:polyphosphate kinase
MDLAMSDTTNAWWLNSDGTWVRHTGEDLQSHLVATRRWRTVDD